MGDFLRAVDQASSPKAPTFESAATESGGGRLQRASRPADRSLGRYRERHREKYMLLTEQDLDLDPKLRQGLADARAEAGKRIG